MALKHCVWALAAGVACVVVAVSAGLVAAPPPLKVDRSKPLLLESPKPSEPKKKPEGPVADNSACFVCHTNYQDESLASVHALENVGCVRCHGASLAHRNDENNTTPPDKMYPAEAIDPACAECHDTHDAPARKVLARWKERCPQKTDFSQVVCTDCHGEHRLKLRSVRWDKKSGKLLTADSTPGGATLGAGQ